MDTVRFDRLARTLSAIGTRRAAVGLLLAATAGGGLAGTRHVAAQTGCTANGARCGDDGECCSGRCKRKPGTRTSFCRRADNQGICTVGPNGCSGGGIGSLICGTNTGGGNCLCLVTAKGQSFCAQGTVQGCDCTSNAECVQRVGTGAKCVQSTDCTSCPGSTTGCAAPCTSLTPPD